MYEYFWSFYIESMKESGNLFKICLDSVEAKSWISHGVRTAAILLDAARTVFN